MINGKAGMTAFLPKYSDMLTLAHPVGEDYAHNIGFVLPKHPAITPLSLLNRLVQINQVLSLFEVNTIFPTCPKEFLQISSIIDQ